jgi:iron complex outermembrane receptor protein
MKLVFRGASSAALIVSLAGGFHAAWAQTPSPQTVTTAAPAPQLTPSAQVDQTARADDQAASGERVVITGSLIATTPEDAPKPVEVITADDLKEAGSPSITEFVRSLTSNSASGANMGGATTGAGVLGNGFVNMDLRGQGANGTLVLMNGRRLATTNGGAGADVNTIPMEALQAVEVLKDGASATYGAGAVGGVINFRTRRDIDAPQITVNKTMYDGSEGGYEINFLTGWVGDAGNLLISASHEEEAGMMQYKRDFGNLPYAINPDGWSLTNLPQRFHRQTNWTTAAPTNTAVGSGGGLVGASTNDFTSNADCAALGGALVQDLQSGTGATTPTACAFPLALTSEIVSEFTQDQVYGEFNADLTESMEFHFDVLYSKYESTGKRPASAGGSTVRVADPTVSALCATTCMYMVPFQQAVYTATGTATATMVQNPFVANYNARQPGTANDLAAGGALLTSSQWRPYLFGGNPLFGNGLAETTVQRERFQINAGLNGEFTGDTFFGKLLNGVTYDYAGQFNQYIQANVANGDWLANRLQDAMMGYGGPGCQAIDRVATDYSSAAAYNRTIGIQSDTAPGTNGCLWFNPFQSNFQTSMFNGAVNPNFPTSGSPTWAANATQAANTGPAGFLNDPVLLDWIWADRTSEVTYNSSTFDAVFTGQVPETLFALPGGEIGWAGGLQWRMTERRGAVDAPNSAEKDLLLQECPYTHMGQAPQPVLPSTQRPTSRGCAGENGTGNFFSGTTPLQPNVGRDPPDYIDSQTIAYFGELSLPVFDTLNLTASLRHESFNGGSIEGTIWSVAGKWDVTDNIYFRSSYGTNFRAEEALDASPGAVVQSTVNDNTRFGTGFNYLRITTTADNVGTEEDITLNVGIGYQGEIFGGQLRASADFFSIERSDEVQTTLATRVLDNVFYDDADDGPNPETDAARLGSPAERADCSARLISFLEFGGNACVQGVTTAADITAVNSVELNGPGFLTEGIDYSIDYTHPLLGGDITFSTTITQNLTYEARPYEVNGIVFDEGGDRLGGRNTLVSGEPSQELRGNASIRWANEVHSIGLRANYQDGFIPDGTRTPIINLAGTANDVFSGYGWGPKDYVDYDLTYIYTAPFWEELELRASILNLTDRAPPAWQSTTGYDTLVGNPRGRIFEIGATKKF